MIQPSSTIRLLKGVYLDSNYDDTYDCYNSPTEQRDIMASKTKHTLNNYTYQRVEKNKIRVALSIEKVIDCNYMMFQNTEYENKWFYAFITNVDYINDTTTELTYKIDVIQTWFLFDCYVSKCFVEREHTATDNIGDNLVPENFELGDYVIHDAVTTRLCSANVIVVASTFNEEYKDVVGSNYSNIFSGLYFNVFNTPAEASEFIQGAGEKSSGIVSVFMMSRDFVTERLGGVKIYDFSVDKLLNNMFVEEDENGEETNTYIIRNKKLYTYPYNFLAVTNLQGTTAEYHYEYFNSDKCDFLVSGDMTPSPSVLCAPKLYKSDKWSVNYNEKITLTNYPQCAYATDSYRQWLSQNFASLPLQAISTGISYRNATRSNNMINSYRARSIAQQSTKDSAYLSAAGMVAESVQHFVMPDQAHGATGNTLNSALTIQDFAFMRVHIREEFARIIDGFFTKYGYAVNEFKVPNIKTRPYWNYLKTNGCEVHGDIPYLYIEEIKEVLNNGITFWHNDGTIGNYNLNNSPQ